MNPDFVKTQVQTLKEDDEGSADSSATVMLQEEEIPQDSDDDVSL
jgi:hypothetical protein